MSDRVMLVKTIIQSMLTHTIVCHTWHVALSREIEKLIGTSYGVKQLTRESLSWMIGKRHAFPQLMDD